MNNRLRLEVTVFDRTEVIDIVGSDFVELTEHVKRCVLKWIEDGMKTPLNISVKNLTSRGPPGKSLSVNVSERAKVTSAFGTR